MRFKNNIKKVVDYDKQTTREIPIRIGIDKPSEFVTYINEESLGILPKKVVNKALKFTPDKNENNYGLASY